MGPSEDDVNARKSLDGSGTDLDLCAGDNLIAKILCPSKEGLILSVSFKVIGVTSVQIFFNNINDEVQDDPTVRFH